MKGDSNEKGFYLFQKEMKTDLQITYVKGSLFGMNEIYERTG